MPVLDYDFSAFSTANLVEFVLILNHDTCQTYQDAFVQLFQVEAADYAGRRGEV